MVVLAGDDAGAAGGADGVGAEGVLENHALGCELVEGRGGVEFFQQGSVGADRLGGVVVTHDEQDVGSVLGYERGEVAQKEQAGGGSGREKSHG